MWRCPFPLAWGEPPAEGHGRRACLRERRHGTPVFLPAQNSLGSDSMVSTIMAGSASVDRNPETGCHAYAGVGMRTYAVDLPSVTGFLPPPPYWPSLWRKRRPNLETASTPALCTQAHRAHKPGSRHPRNPGNQSRGMGEMLIEVSASRGVLWFMNAGVAPSSSQTPFLRARA